MGQDFPGFRLESGVRQGCPLSPLLFAVCVDILLRMIAQRLGDATVRAFADDIAAVLSDVSIQIPILEEIFIEFERILNFGSEHQEDCLHTIVGPGSERATACDG